MPKITPFLEQVVYLVAEFLTSIQHNKEAEKLKKEYQLPEWVKINNPLMKKGLKKVLKQYINENQKVLKYFKSRKPEEQQEQAGSQDETVKPSKKQILTNSPKHSPITKPKSPKQSNLHVQKALLQNQKPKGWVASQFQQPKRLQDLNYDNNEQQINKTQVQIDLPKKNKKHVAKKQQSQQSESSQQQVRRKKQKKLKKKQKKVKKVKGPVDSSYLNSQDEFQLEKRKNSITPQKKEKARKMSVQKNEKQEQAAKVDSIVTRKKSTQIHETKQKIQVDTLIKVQKNGNDVNQEINNYQNGPKKFFSRVDHEQVGFIPQNRRDNRFEAKARYGAGDAWGEYGYDKLKDTRGDSFKKTKGKLKNKAFQGSGININQINSVPIL